MTMPGLVGASLFQPPPYRRPAKPAARPKRSPGRGRLWVSIAYDPGKNLGAAYNAEMRRIGERDWMCFLDHDAMWTTRSWYRQIAEAMSRLGSAGAFTAVTNRVGARWQRVGDPANHDMRYHRRLGQELAARYGSKTRDVTDASPRLSGVVIVISKLAWTHIGGFASGFLGVDNRMHEELRRVGRKVYLLPGLYVYHWYRADGDVSHLEGTKRA
jgi:GT2 family glycosyltransferase